jgi:HK97 family phage major capsid protein
MSKSIELRSTWSGLVAEAKQIYQKSKDESREPTQDETNEFERLMSQSDKVKSDIYQAERGERLEHAEAELRAVQPRVTIPAQVKHEPSPLEIRSAVRSWALGDSATADQKYKASLMGIDCDNPRLEVRGLSVGTTTAGGYSVPTNMTQQIEVYTKYFGNAREWATVFQTENGDALQYPAFDDTANTGQGATETQVPADNVDPVFGQPTWLAKDYSSDVVRVSVRLLKDSNFDIDALIGEALGTRIGRIQNTDHMAGTGGGTAPNGLLTSSVSGVQLAAGNAITYAKLKALEHSIDISYRRLPGAGWVMSDAMFQAVELIQDDNHRPLFIQSLNDASQYRLFGYPVYINSDFTYYPGNEGSNKPMAVFGALKKFGIRDIANSTEVVRLNEVYRVSDPGRQIGFLIEGRGWCERIGPSGCYKSLNSAT